MTTAKRPRNAEQTRSDILAAAKRVFSLRGYAQAGIREIAGEAGVNSALIQRYFGSKEALFREALEQALDLSGLLVGTPQTFGQTVVAYLRAHRAGESNPLSMLILATSDADARRVTVDILQRVVIEPFARWLGTPEPQLHAVLLTTLLSGIWLYRDLLPLTQLSGTLDDRAATWIEQAVQQLANGLQPSP